MAEQNPKGPIRPGRKLGMRPHPRDLTPTNLQALTMVLDLETAPGDSLPTQRFHPCSDVFGVLQIPVVVSKNEIAAEGRLQLTECGVQPVDPFFAVEQVAREGDEVRGKSRGQ